MRRYRQGLPTRRRTSEGSEGRSVAPGVHDGPLLPGLRRRRAQGVPTGPLSRGRRSTTHDGPVGRETRICEWSPGYRSLGPRIRRSGPEHPDSFFTQLFVNHSRNPLDSTGSRTNKEETSLSPDWPSRLHYSESRESCLEGRPALDTCPSPPLPPCSLAPTSPLDIWWMAVPVDR